MLGQALSRDISLFQQLAERSNVPLEVSPILRDIFVDGQKRYGPRELSPNIVKRLEEACEVEIQAVGFPPEITDDEAEERGYEVVVKRG